MVCATFSAGVFCFGGEVRRQTVVVVVVVVLVLVLVLVLVVLVVLGGGFQHFFFMFIPIWERFPF